MRSKTLFVANILATVYSAALLWIFGGAVIKAGGAEFIEALSAYFDAVLDLIQMSSPKVAILYGVLILLGVHIVAFTLGCIIGWVALAKKKSGGAKFAAVLYLIGTLCFPVYLVFGLPITILGFIGAGKQKKLNRASVQ